MKYKSFLNSYFLLFFTTTLRGKKAPYMVEKKAMIPCPECKGKGSITCPDCRGQGRRLSSTAMQQPCMNCHGKGTSVCPVCWGARNVEKSKKEEVKSRK